MMCPCTLLETRAFYHRMLLLRGPESTFPPTLMTYKITLIIWAKTLKPYGRTAIENETLLNLMYF